MTRFRWLNAAPAMWPADGARLLLVAMIGGMVVYTGVNVVTGVGIFATDFGVPGLPIVLAVGAIQLRHSLAAAEGRRAEWWPLSYALLLALILIPAPLLTYRWNTMTWFLIGSSLMLLPARASIAVTAATTIFSSTWWTLNAGLETPEPQELAWLFWYAASVTLLGGLSLFAAARLVRSAAILRGARMELADLATARERLRISRDLHDVLGRALSTISLRGDLADELISAGNLPAAVTEITTLREVVADAKQDLRDLAFDRRPVHMREELRLGVSLLESAGITTVTKVEVGDLDPKIDALFGWTVREGITNVLRHSSATACSILIERADGNWRAEIENDGAGPVDRQAAREGTGLANVRLRSSEMGGWARVKQPGDGSFRLAVEVPEQ
jgi:two-component system sensor histidine kinase DesK